MTKHQLSVIESSVLALIPRGSVKKVSVSEIISLIDLDRRSVQSVVYSLIKKGIPICSSREFADGGLFIATTVSEREHGLKSYESQAKEMLTRVELVRQANLELWHTNILTTTQGTLEVS